MKKKKLIFIILFILFILLIISIKIISGDLISLSKGVRASELKEVGENLFEKYLGGKIEIKYIKISYVDLDSIEEKEIFFDFE